jgi:hypothetical protein
MIALEKLSKRGIKKNTLQNIKKILTSLYKFFGGNKDAIAADFNDVIYWGWLFL